MKKMKLPIVGLLALIFMNIGQLKAQFVPEANSVYFIKSAESAIEGLVIGDYNLSDGYASVAEFTGQANQQFKFIDSGDVYNENKQYRLQLQSSGKNLNRIPAQSWISGFTSDETTTFWIDNTPGDGIVYLYKVYGTDSKSHLAGLDDGDNKIYLNKSTSQFSKWKIVKATDGEVLDGAKSVLSEAISTAELLLPTLTTGLQISFNTEIETAKMFLTSEDADEVNAAISTLKEKSTTAQDFADAVKTAKKSLKAEGDFSAGTVEKEALEDAIAAAEAATSFDGLATLILNMEEATTTYLATETKPLFDDIVDVDVLYRFFCANEERSGEFAYYNEPGVNDKAMKHKSTFTTAADSASRYFKFVKVSDGVYHILLGEDADAADADKKYVYSRGSGGNGMQTRAAKGKNANNEGKWAITYVNTVNGVKYFSFNASSSANYLFFGKDGNDMKTLSGYGTIPSAGGSIDDYKIAILEEGQPFLSVLKKQIVNAQDFYDDTAVLEGMTDGKYSSASREALADAIIAAQEVSDDDTLTDEDQAEIDDAATGLYVALDVYKASKIIIVRTALEAKIAEVREILDDAEEGDFDGQYAEGSIAILQAVVDAADAVLIDKNEPATQADVDQFVEDLNTALSAFEEGKVVIDFVDLDEAVTKAEGYVEEYGTVEDQDLLAALGELSTVLESAQGIDRAAILQEEVNLKFGALATQLTIFETARFIYMTKDLNALITQAKEYAEEIEPSAESDDDLNAVYGALSTAIENAEAIQEGATQGEIDIQIDALQKALDNIEEAYLVYLGKDLKSLIDEAQKFHNEAKEGDKVGEYPTDSKVVLQTAIDVAESFLNAATAESDFEAEKVVLEKALEDFKATVITDSGIGTFVDNGIAVYSLNGKLIIDGLEGEVFIACYDLNGRTVFVEKCNAGQFSRELSTGNYVVSLGGYMNANGIVIVK